MIPTVAIKGHTCVDSQIAENYEHIQLYVFTNSSTQ